MWFFHTNQTESANELVRRYHYSHRPPSNVQIVGTLHKAGGLFGDFGICVAACFFSVPPTRWKEDVFELSRLVRRDDTLPPLTFLISKTCGQIRRKKMIDLVVSYADATWNHHGGIYQAASWNYHGVNRVGCDGLIVNGVFVPGRSCNSKWGTRSPQKLKSMFPLWEIESHYDDGKHLYWKPLTRAGKRKAMRLGLNIKAYPKPDNNEAAA